MLKPYLALAATMLVWGVAPAFVRSFSLTAGPGDSMFIRLVSVALMALPFLPFSGIYIARKDWPRLLLASWVGIFGYFIGSIFGFTYVTSGVGGLIMATQPLVIALMAAAIGSERLTPMTLLGLAISFAGAIYLFWEDLVSTSSNNDALIGGAMIFGCGIAFGISVLASKPLVQTYGSLRTTLVTMILCAVPALPFYNAGITDQILSLDAFAWGSLVYLGLIGTILAVITWNYALARLRPTAIGASLYVVPLLSIIAGYVVLSEPISTRTLGAGLIILAGVAVSEFGGKLKWGGGSVWIGIALVTFAVVMWGLVPVAMRYLLMDVSPQTALILRLYPAGMLAGIIALTLGFGRLSNGDWLRLIGAALIGNFGYQTLAAFGMDSVPASWTGMLFGLEPVFIAMGAAIFAGERLSYNFVVGLFVALLGTGVLMFSSATGTVVEASFPGLVMITLSTFGWAIYTLLIKPVSQRQGAFPIACLSIALTLIPLPFFTNVTVLREVANLSPQHWMSVAFVSIFATVLATGAWNMALNHMRSATAGMFLYVQPIIAAIGGIMLLGEQLSIWLLTGGVLILLGVAISQINPVVRRRRPEVDEPQRPPQMIQQPSPFTRTRRQNLRPAQ